MKWSGDWFDADLLLKLRFEDKDDIDGILPNEMRDLRLVAIREYALKHGLDEAAKHAEAAISTNEDINVVLEEIGFTFDGEKLYELDVEDKIYTIPSTKRQLHLNETNDDL